MKISAPRPDRIDLTRRKLLRGMSALVVGCAAGTIALASPAAAQAVFPTRVVTLIVPFAAGGSTDVLARIIADGMTKDLGQQVIVENVPGAGGRIAGRRVLSAPADGYTLLIGNTGTLAANSGFYKEKPYDVATDFIALASVADAPQLLIARNGLPVANLDEFAAYARQNEAKMTFGAAGVGSGSFLGGVLLNAALGLKITPVNYRGSGAVMNDIVSQNVDYMVESTTAALPQVQGGTLRGVAVLQKSRIEAAPQVPAAGESKFVDLNYRIWNIVVAHKGTPPEIIERLNASIRKTLADEAVVGRMSQLGLERTDARRQTPEGAMELLVAETARWLPLVAGLGLSLD